MRPFLIVVHDITPAFAIETKHIIRDLAPHIGRAMSFGVVPDWHGKWPLSSHSEFCNLVRDSADELLLHGYFHRRQHGSGPVSWLAERSDEMNGLTFEETRLAIREGQDMFRRAFGDTAHGFLPPAWQKGRLLASSLSSFELQYTLGYFSILSNRGERRPLATYTWDCGKWSALGEVGHGFGLISSYAPGRAPTLAIHPRDIARGFWPRILKLVRSLIDGGFTPITPSRLLNLTVRSTIDAQVTV